MFNSLFLATCICVLLTTLECPAIGIDLGTSYSRVGIFQNGKVEIITNDQHEKRIPSYVAFTSNERLIGNSAENQANMNPKNTIFSAKRLIGQEVTVTNDKIHWPFDKIHWPFDVVNDRGKPKIKVEYKGETKQLLAVEISSMILTKLKKTAETYLGKAVNSAVVTVPACFNDSQRQATIDACTIAGLNDLHIINEPTAAAIAYSLDKKSVANRNILIFHLGGGTFNVSIIAIKDSKIEVQAIRGDTHIGGEDFDNEMVKYFIKEFRQNYHKDISQNKSSLYKLRKSCESAKHELSFKVQTKIEILSLFDGIDFYSNISRARFEALGSSIFQRTMELVEECLEDANIDKDEICDVLLLGGSTRIPKIHESLKRMFAKKSLVELQPEAVACGATIRAAILSGNSSEELSQLELNDVVSLSIGIETTGGIMSVVIKRNTFIPCNVYKDFDNDSDVSIWVYEGEHLIAKNNNYLGRFPVPKGVQKTRVIFSINKNGILTLKDYHKNTVMLPYDQGGLSTEKIQMLTAKEKEYEIENCKQKECNEAKNDCEKFAIFVDTTMKDDYVKSIVGKKEFENVVSSCNKVIELLQINHLASKQEYNAHEENLRKVFTPIMEKLRADGRISIPEDI